MTTMVKKEVPHCHTDDTHKILAVILAPDDNNSQQVEIIYKLASQFGDRLRVGCIVVHDVLHALNTTLMRLLNYPLPTLTITEEECTHIMVPN